MGYKTGGMEASQVIPLLKKSRWRGAEQVLAIAQHVSIRLEMGGGGGGAKVVPCSEVEAGAQQFWNRDFPVL